MDDPTNSGRYVLRGGVEGRARLSVISQALRHSTRALLEEVTSPAPFRAVDLGCGGGDVTLQIARLAGAGGHVVGIDMDATKLQMAAQDAEAAGLGTVEFRVEDARQLAETGTYDLAYARFLLTHLSAPERLVKRMAGAVAPSGLVVVEDIDYSGVVCHPRCPAIDRHVALYRELVRRRGGDADIGPRLPALLRSAGLARVQARLVQPVFFEGDPKFIYSITTSSIADVLVEEGMARAEEIAALIEQLEEFARAPDTMIGFPRIVQAWGYRSP